ncbi:MAG: hypothetical protein JST30_08405 [Armatimonadetes bacterium]|nr:hypothetical protein [Armatimonadota bacterium]
MQQETLRELLVRAEEIQQQSSVEIETRSEVQELIVAAEESGVSRDAILQALRERISATERPLTEGELAFVTSSDGHQYVARTLDVGPHSVKVRFLKGGEASVPRTDVKPLSVMPGQTLCCPWPNWGWWNCKVVGYDPENLMVRVTDGWTEQASFHLSDVRLNKPSAPGFSRLKDKLFVVGIALGSGLLGALVQFLLTRPR